MKIYLKSTYLKSAYMYVILNYTKYMETQIRQYKRKTKKLCMEAHCVAPVKE